MDKYHIGTRLRGFAKGFFKDQKIEIDRDDLKYVPHMTLLRPFYTSNEDLLVKSFDKTLSSHSDIIPFKITNFHYFENDKTIIYGEVEKNLKIENMIHSLEGSLEKIIDFEYPKIGNEINLHITISGEGDLSVMKKLEKEVLPIDQYLLRAYLLKNKLILREYDIYLKDSLGRKDAKSKRVFEKTIDEFKKQTGLIPTQNGFIKF